MQQTERPAGTSWDEAKSIRDLGWMNIAWLLGDVATTPINPGPTDPGDSELIPSLELMNNLGLVSAFAQPGRADRSGSQRATLRAFGEPSVVQEVAAACDLAGLHVRVRPLGDAARQNRVVIDTDANGSPQACAGEPISAGDLLPHFHCRPELRRELGTALSVSIIDLDWGRQDLLWNSVLEGLRRWLYDDSTVLPTTVSNRGLVRYLAREILESA